MFLNEFLDRLVLKNYGLCLLLPVEIDKKTGREGKSIVFEP